MKKLFSKKGQQLDINFVLSFIVVMGVGTVLTVLTSVIASKTYVISEAEITGISNVTNSSGGGAYLVEEYVKDTIAAGFQASKTGNEFVPIIYIGFVMAIVIGLIFSIMAISNVGAGGSIGGGSIL